MKVVGMVCEFNPFHRAHEEQLRLCRGEDAAMVCVMSGNFVQRGDFAICRKHVRAAAALQGGADLVLELPTPYAVSSAETFARAGVELLNACGVVEEMVFGSECADTEKLLRAADALADERFLPLLREKYESGCSFAAAREAALFDLIGADSAVLHAPNDILGVEYCKALLQTQSAIVPRAVPRIASAHDGVNSAKDLRERIARGEQPDGLTEEMAQEYEKERAAGRAPVLAGAAERAILARLRSMQERDFAAYDSGNEGLYHRFYEVSRTARSIEELLSGVKSKRYAYAHLRRMLLSVFLHLPADEAQKQIPYLRVLGSTGRGREILRRMQKDALLPIVTKPADARRISPRAAELMACEARCTDLYTLAYPDLAAADGGAEWRQSAIVL